MPDYRKFFLIKGVDGPDIDCFLDIVGLGEGDKKRTTAVLGFMSSHEDAHPPLASHKWTPHPEIRERWAERDDPIPPAYLTFVGEYEVKSLLTVLSILGQEAERLRTSGPLERYQDETDLHGTTRAESHGSMDDCVGVNDIWDLSQIFRWT